MKVVLLDRDGVINRDRIDYVKSLAELEILPGVPEAIAKLNRAGYAVFVISNQQAIGKGIISPETLDLINGSVRKSVEEAGGRITAMYHCPHLHAEKCGCRKPDIGMLTRAGQDYDFDLSDAWFIGDSPGDFEAGRRAGCKTVAVLTGKLSAEDIEKLPIRPQYITENLGAAVEIVIAESSSNDPV